MLRKFSCSLILALITLLTMLSPSVYATEFIIYRCTSIKGKIKFQDFECAAMEEQQISFAPNDTNPEVVSNSLREHEVKALDRLHALQVHAKTVTQNQNHPLPPTPITINIYQNVDQTNLQQNCITR